MASLVFHHYSTLSSDSLHLSDRHSATSNRLSLLWLPDEVLVRLICLLPLQSKVALLFCNRKLRRLGCDGQIWESINFPLHLRYHSDPHSSGGDWEHPRSSGAGATAAAASLNSSDGTVSIATAIAMADLKRHPPLTATRILGTILGTVLPAVGHEFGGALLSTASPDFLAQRSLKSAHRLKCAGGWVKQISMRGAGRLFGDSELAQVARWTPGLEALDVSETAVTDQGIAYLLGRRSGAAEGWNVVKKHDLSAFPVGDFGRVVDLLHGRATWDSATASPPPPPTPSPDFRVGPPPDSSGRMYLSGKESPRCPFLERLELSDLRRITDVSLNLVGEMCQALKHLNLSSISSSSRVTDVGMMAVIDGCHCLETLRFTGATQVTDLTLIKIAQSPHAQQRLQELDCSGCFHITSGGIKAVLTSCVALEVLDVGYCWRLDDQAFSYGQPVGDPPSDTTNRNGERDGSIAADENKGSLARVPGRRLRWISLIFCYNVSDAAVRSILQTFKHLERIDLMNCTAVSREMRSQLEEGGINVGETAFMEFSRLAA
ncbi:hypothetical protein DFJ73DRAFT_228370 [Zopfochytrium polystomum]|nr:hypothetical protein DFJ73DRAFT_228370 [Zopfochytrium polystomum]